MQNVKQKEQREQWNVFATFGENIIVFGSLGGQLSHTSLNPRVCLLSLGEETVQIKKIIKRSLLVFVNVFILIKYISAHSLCFISIRLEDFTSDEWII